MNTPDAELRARMVEAAKDAFADETTVGDKGPIRLLTDGRNPWRALDDALAAAWAVIEHHPRGSTADYAADWVPTLAGMDRLQAAVPSMYDEDLHDLLYNAYALVGAIESEQRKRQEGR